MERHASLREQAARCRRLSRDVADDAIAKSLLDMADDLDREAAALEDSVKGGRSRDFGERP